MGQELQGVSECKCLRETGKAGGKSKESQSQDVYPSCGYQILLSMRALPVDTESLWLMRGMRHNEAAGGAEAWPTTYMHSLRHYPESPEQVFLVWQAQRFIQADGLHGKKEGRMNEKSINKEEGKMASNFGCMYKLSSKKVWNGKKKSYEDVDIHCLKLTGENSVYCPKHVLFLEDEAMEKDRRLQKKVLDKAHREAIAESLRRSPLASINPSFDESGKRISGAYSR